MSSPPAAWHPGKHQAPAPFPQGKGWVWENVIQSIRLGVLVGFCFLLQPSVWHFQGNLYCMRPYSIVMYFVDVFE